MLRIYLRAPYDDMAHWESTRGPSPEPSDPEMRGIWEKARDAVMERRSITLETNVKALRPISLRRP